MNATTTIPVETMAAYRMVLVACTILNVAAWLAEWLVAVAAGLNAARGRPYPLTRREKRIAAVGEASSDVPPDWKPLNDG